MNLALRQALALCLGLAAVLGSGCSKNAEVPAQSSETQTPRLLLGGTLNLADSAKSQADPLAVLFVIARNEKGQIAAVKKMFPPFQYPLAFTLSDADAMIAGTQLSGKLTVTARLDKDGNANPAQPGDILGKGTLDGYAIGTKDVEIVLNEAVQP